MNSNYINKILNNSLIGKSYSSENKANTSVNGSNSAKVNKLKTKTKPNNFSQNFNKIKNSQIISKNSYDSNHLKTRSHSAYGKSILFI